MFLLILNDSFNRLFQDVHLHSTMFLLIRDFMSLMRRRVMNLHSTMFLLILYTDILVKPGDTDLHSTMFLLIRVSGLISKFSLSPFTFHYVSTYTGRQVTDPVWIIRIYIPLCFYLYNQRVPGEPSDRGHLHSTMFLLIHIQVLEFFKRSLIYIPLCFYLYLYISCAPVGSSQFTFHYVSTYTLM